MLPGCSKYLGRKRPKGGRRKRPPAVNQVTVLSLHLRSGYKEPHCLSLSSFSEPTRVEKLFRVWSYPQKFTNDEHSSVGDAPDKKSFSQVSLIVASKAGSLFTVTHSKDVL